MRTATITDIKRFAVHDGDGIRTTIFFKGCPLKCVWCHNPEAISFKPETAYIDRKCIGCHECENICDANLFDSNGKHLFVRDKCIGCGNCRNKCLGESLIFYGREVTVNELLEKILEDKSFYDNSGGGMTVSGGEPLMQADFVSELLRRCKENGVSTAVDTCGFVSKESIDKVLPYTNIFLYDLKHINEQSHIKCTGHSNKTILDNLLYIDKVGVPFEIRIPYVPQFNDDAIDGIGAFLSATKHLTRIKVLPYHSYAGSKYESLGMQNTLPKVNMPDNDEIDRAVEILNSFGLCAVNGKEA